MSRGNGCFLHMTDDMGLPVVLASPPRRIVSLVPSLTETVCLLGAAEKLVGITDYCTEPSHLLAGKSRVGGTKNPSIDKIVSLSPDLVLANAEENKKEHVELLRRRTQVFVTFPRTVIQAIRTYRDLALMTEAPHRGKEFAASCRSILSGAEHDRRRFRALCFVWKEPWTLAGRDTYLSDLLSAMGFDNVCRKGERYPRVSLEEAAAFRPELILLPEEPYPFTEEEAGEVSAAMETGGAEVRTLVVDGKALCWFGARTLMGLRYLRDLKKSLAEEDERKG